jgi:4-hydroxybenzoyl-CoA thioesterase
MSPKGRPEGESVPKRVSAEGSPANAWHSIRAVRFGHCDPAGIVFYPRFFEIAHEALEDWFRDGLGLPFPEMIGVRREGFPVVALATRFHAPSRLGDELDVAIDVTRIGGASLDVRYVLTCAGAPRVEITTTIVHTDLESGRPRPIEGELRRRFEAFLVDAGEAGGGR